MKRLKYLTAKLFDLRDKLAGVKHTKISFKSTPIGTSSTEMHILE